MKLKDMIRVYGLAAMLASNFMLFGWLWWSYLFGGWTVRLDFNLFGEGMIELTMLTLSVIPSIMVFHNVLDNIEV